MVEFRFSQNRAWTLDYAWPGSRVAIEQEGGVWIHGRHSRGEGDYEKHNELARYGWRVGRFTPRQMRAGDGVKWVKEVLDREKRGPW